jgi:hypothetical protein
MTENHSIPAVTLKIIDAKPGFSILFCKSALFRKKTNRITRPTSVLPTPFTDFPLQPAFTPRPFPDNSQTQPFNRNPLSENDHPH